jgi:hypothetical protein
MDTLSPLNAKRKIQPLVIKTVMPIANEYPCKKC